MRRLRPDELRLLSDAVGGRLIRDRLIRTGRSPEAREEAFIEWDDRIALAEKAASFQESIIKIAQITLEPAATGLQEALVKLTEITLEPEEAKSLQESLIKIAQEANEATSGSVLEAALEAAGGDEDALPLEGIGILRAIQDEMDEALLEGEVAVEDAKLFLASRGISFPKS